MRHCLQFQSTHPVRGATPDWLRALANHRFQSTHPVRGATAYERRGAQLNMISIHAPREGCDDTVFAWLEPQNLFQSTHPVRGATRLSCRPSVWLAFQSTHPVRGATGVEGQCLGMLLISIHAPREGCDLHLVPPCGLLLIFQSTHPVRGATRARGGKPRQWGGFQSTHPVRGATDGLRVGAHDEWADFNPRTP